MNSHQLLLDLCKEGYKKRIKPFISQKKMELYIDRLKYELRVINKLGFDDYFLIVQDIVNSARANGVRVGPGRGSAAGSLVSYGLGVTDLNPIKYQLYFERFLNEDRVSAPDIDIDFASKGRHKVFDYIKRKYGEDRVCQVISYSRMKSRGLVGDLAKAMGVDPLHASKMTKLIDGASENVEEAFGESEELKEWAIKYPELFDIAMQLNGCIKNAGKHAAGVLITKDLLVNCLPIMLGAKNALVSQYDKDALEHLNFLKMDILGLDTLDVIDETCKLIGKDPLGEHDLDLRDANVLGEFCKAHTEGVFTFETYGMKNTLKKVQPGKLEDLSAVNALYRPGAIQGIDFFLQGKETGAVYYFDDEKLKPVLEETYGTITYQEQTMAIVQLAAGFSPSKADVVRRAIGKKKPEELEQLKGEFLQGCVKTGHTKDWAENLFRVIEQGNRYSFNKSHAMAYSLLGYQCMYLKYYYPVEFMTRRLSNTMGKAWEKGNRLDKYEKEAKRLGIEIVDWDINTSSAEYVCDVESKQIFRGLSAIKNVGQAAEEIERLKPFRSFNDFYTRINKSKVRSSAIEALVNAGCFDSIEKDRSKMRRYIGTPQSVKEENVPQRSLFDE